VLVSVLSMLVKFCRVLLCSEHCSSSIYGINSVLVWSRTPIYRSPWSYVSFTTLQQRQHEWR